MEQSVENFYSILRSRNSVREYSSKPIEREKINRLFDVLQRSQSAANCQPWHFIILEKEDNRDEFDTIFRKECFKKAPVVIVACADLDKGWKRNFDGKNYAVVDVTIAITDMIAAATAEGLGTCWIAAFDPEKLFGLLKLPKNIEPVGIITIGYPAKPLTIVKKNRKPLSEIIHYGKW